MDGDVSNLIPQCLLNPEFQGTILLGLTCVGAWVIVTLLIQIMFTVLWPFFLVITILVLMPNWRKGVAREFLPRYIETVKSLTQRFLNYNSTET